MKDYFPYKNRADAINEYNSLRNELLESQKQRINLLTASIAIITAIFAYLSRDKIFETYESAILIYFSIIPSIYSYATRTRERRIADYISVFLNCVSPWSKLSSSNDSKLRLNIFQRASTSIIIGFILFDIIVLLMPLFGGLVFDYYSIIGAVGLIINTLILYYTSNLKSFKHVFNDEFEKTRKNIAQQ